MKIVINTNCGGFSLSVDAVERLAELGCGEAAEQMHAWKADELFFIGYGEKLWRKRDDDRLVQVVEELGEAADSQHAKLKVVEIPDGVKWEIHDDHGLETVHEIHRSWS